MKIDMYFVCLFCLTEKSKADARENCGFLWYVDFFRVFSRSPRTCLISDFLHLRHRPRQLLLTYLSSSILQAKINDIFLNGNMEYVPNPAIKLNDTFFHAHSNEELLQNVIQSY